MIAADKHSSLLVLNVSDEENTLAYLFGTWVTKKTL